MGVYQENGCSWTPALFPAVRGACWSCLRPLTLLLTPGCCPSCVSALLYQHILVPSTCKELKRSEKLPGAGRSSYSTADTKAEIPFTWAHGYICLQSSSSRQPAWSRRNVILHTWSKECWVGAGSQGAGIWERQNKRAFHARHPHQSCGSRAHSLGCFLPCLQEARHAEIKRNLFCGRKGHFFWPGIPVPRRRQEAYYIKGKLIKYLSAGERGGMSKTCQCSLEKITVVSYSFPDNICGVS